MKINTRDLAAGGLFVVIGLAFGLNAWFTLRIGDVFAMGPGYFPVALGLILAGFGVAIALQGIGRPSEAFGHVPWRGLVLVIGAIFFFGVTVRGLGMAPALFVGTLMSSLSTGRMTLLAAAALSLAITVFSVLVFIYALALPYPVFGLWLTG
jgi:hypothetical protein